MRRASDPFRVGDASSIGWISTADVFVYASVMFLIVALVLDARLAKGDPKELLAKIDRQNAQIAALEAKNAQLETTIEHLETEIAALRSENGRLKQSERELQMQLAAMRIERDALSTELRTVKVQRDALRAQVAVLQIQYLELADEYANLFKMHQGKTQEVDEANDRYAGLVEEGKRERRLRRELIGLQGKMLAVSIVIDCSGSMLENNRWDSARKVLDDWLQNLDMASCRIIVFSNTVRVFPEDGTFLSLDKSEGAANREAISTYLKGIQPEGGTNTLAALEKAYESPELDAIVLFTDGAPNDGNSYGIDKKIAGKIYERCAAEWEKRKIPINAVGLGDYFHKDLSEFLLEVSRVTHGTFIGR